MERVEEVPAGLVDAGGPRTAAAEQGHVAAQHSLGMMLCCARDGGAPKDMGAGIKWVFKAAEQGHAAAQKLILNFAPGGVPKELDGHEGMGWLTTAGEQWHASAQNNLTMITYSGDEGVPEDVDVAKECESI